ncbi:SDR family oxidoreductase [Propioniciclava sinopodophylli]|uniref:SDR family oxidoreductase n=1 Tax=Propioniciclava sinopodophylli TaxID=1837344 RepID=UPI002490B2A1|nr:SDR family oxidoreductase [Propioniciclava sinopodophylli]
MSDTPVHTVLVIGATGRIGRLVVAAALRHGLDVRALVRDSQRAVGVLPGATLVQGDLTRAADLTAAVAGVDAVILTHGSAGYGARDLEDVDYGAVANLLTALDGRRVRVALMTSINVNELSGAYQDVLDWKRRGERLLRASGLPATIVRPGWFATLGATNQAVALEQGDTRHGDQVDTRQVAEALVQAVMTDAAVGKTFELFAARGPAPADWTPLFAGLDADLPGSLDGAHDRPNMPLSAEPARVRTDLDRLTGRP